MTDDLQTPPMPRPDHPAVRRDDDGRDVIDLSGYRSAAGAAKALHGALRACLQAEADWWESMDLTHRGPGPDSVHLRRPDDSGLAMDEDWAAGAWHVVWEDGPFEWASSLTGGSGLYRGEGYGDAGPRLVPPGPRVDCTVGWTFSLLFRD